MIKKNNHLTKTLFASALIICATVQSAQAGRYYHARESVEVADHHVFGTSERVDGATSLVRNFRHRMICLLYTSPSPRDRQKSRMPSSA